ncbi:hypothetical protein KC353_g15149 [Hortaea werneckii]|nr:hypothetical protein KC353_g15149 [Hortaea werneckii]
MPKSASFDVLGTCFDFDTAISTIDKRLGSKLKPLNVDPKTLFFSWFYAAQRDFTYTSMVGSYVPIAQILKFTLRRACAVVGLPGREISDEDVAAVMGEMSGWDVYAVTNGGKETSLNYYKLANIDLDANHLLSCDDIKVAKPDVKVYERTHEHLTSQGLGKEGDSERWFVAAHAWDLIAARKAGFKTAYLAHEEHDPVTQVFGEFDLYAEDMPDLLEKMRKL